MNNDIIVITWGGIGDLIVCTPTLKAIKEAHPGRRLIVYCRIWYHREVLYNNPHIDSIRLLSPKHMWRYPRHLYYYLFKREKIKYYSLFFQHIPPSWIYQKATKEIVPEIFADLGIRVSDKKTQLFFTKQEEEKARQALAPYKNVVLTQIHSKSSVNHRWYLERWEALVQTLPEFTFIQLGTTYEECVKGAIDWRGKTSIREALCLVKYADSFVGIDSSLSHATNAFDVPGVIIFGDSSPVFWGHENNINLYKGISCSPCYYYTDGRPCPFDHECMKLIGAEEVRQALLRQMEAGNKRRAALQISSATLFSA